MQSKKKPFGAIKSRIFQSLKIRIFPKGLTHALVKKCHFFVYVDLEKFGLEIMLNDFAQEKETFLTLKNRIFQSPKNCIYPKRLTQAFDEKVPIFLLYLDLVKIRLEIFPSVFAEKKKNICDLKKISRIFRSPNNRIFFQRV